MSDSVIGPNDISKELWEVLHKMGLPRCLISATIIMDPDQPITVNAKFYLTDSDGSPRLDELKEALMTASADFIIVRKDKRTFLQRIKSWFSGAHDV